MNYFHVIPVDSPSMGLFHMPGPALFCKALIFVVFFSTLRRTFFCPFAIPCPLHMPEGTMHKKLFIPGPTEVAPDVLQKLATPMIGHRTKDASNLQREISGKMQQVMFTQNPIILSTSSGSGLMEGSIRSLTAKRAIVFSVGAFGNRWFKVAEANNVPADKHETEWGKATTPEVVEKYLSTGKYDVFTVTHNETSTGIMNPVEEIAEVRRKYPDVLWLVDAVSSMAGAKVDVDTLGIDVCITSTQKALALPPGMAIASVSRRALDHGKQVKYLEHGVQGEAPEKMLKEIISEIRQKWDVEKIAFCYRKGKIGAGEGTIVIAVAATHRQEAFAACQYAIDRFKEILPTKKEETYQDGSIWVGE